MFLQERLARAPVYSSPFAGLRAGVYCCGGPIRFGAAEVLLDVAAIQEAEMDLLLSELHVGVFSMSLSLRLLISRP